MYILTWILWYIFSQCMQYSVLKLYIMFCNLCCILWSFLSKINYENMKCQKILLRKLEYNEHIQSTAWNKYTESFNPPYLSPSRVHIFPAITMTQWLPLYRNICGYIYVSYTINSWIGKLLFVNIFKAFNIFLQIALQKEVIIQINHCKLLTKSKYHFFQNDRQQ